jgi:hypothetical protein
MTKPEAQVTRQTIDLRISPSDETIRLGPLAVRFLITGEDSNGSVAISSLRSQPRSA